MQFAAEDLTARAIRYSDLENLEALFEKEFGDEVNMDLVRTKLRKLRRFYFLLLPLRGISPWIRSFWNIFIFKIKGDFAGFIQTSFLGEKRLHLDFIAICKKYRGQGLGRYILSAMLNDFTDPQQCGVVLEVRLDNPAYGLYRRLGFAARGRILHYEREFGAGEHAAWQNHPVILLQRLPESERAQAQKLYLHSISPRLRLVHGEEKRFFPRGMVQRQLENVKYCIFRRRTREYIVRVQDKVIASVNVISYEKASYHILSIYMDPSCEPMRKKILQQAIAELSERYGEGKISTTIYDDAVGKQHALIAAGFVRKDAYFLMYRKARSRQAVRYCFNKERMRLHRWGQKQALKKVTKKSEKDIDR